TLKGIDPFAKKSKLFFNDLASNDSTLHKRAVKQISDINIDNEDLPLLEKAIVSVNWNEKKYLDTKKSLISKLGDLKTETATDYLKGLYYKLNDTVELQYTVLESLLQQKTAYS